MINQRTIAKSTQVTGIGLHSGKKVTLKINPAPADYGIQFIRVDIPNTKGTFLPNLLSVIKFRDDFKKDVITVPTKTLQDDGKHIYVFTVENGVAHKKNLTIGHSYDGKTVILEGLKPPEKVVVKGQTMIVEGSLVDAQ